jgi:5-methylcytosine-specific restriction endonuclease McrA
MADAVDTATKTIRQCDITRRANAEARRSRVCEQCGTPFIQGSLSKKQRLAGHVQRYCSNRCRAEASRLHADTKQAKKAYYRRRRQREGLPALPRPVDCERCGASFTQTQITQKRCSACRGVTADARYECAVCGKGFQYEATGGRPRNTCSDDCAREVLRALRKRVKLRRRRRLHGPGSETVVPAKVFARDRWTCQRCWCPTPSHLRGTYEANAPELDHVVPLALGGMHTYGNTQCLCRQCNHLKGATLQSA